MFSALSETNLIILPFPKWQILESSKLKEFADDNCKSDENGGVFQNGRKHCGKRRNCSLRGISPFPQCFHKTFTAHMQKQGLVWERVKPHLFLALRFRSLEFCHMVKGMYAIYNGLSYRSSKDSK